MIRVQDIDRYGRFVGRVYIDDLDINAEMVRLGAAWVDDKYVVDLTLYDLQTEARTDRRGIGPSLNPSKSLLGAGAAASSKTQHRRQKKEVVPK